MAFCVAVAGIKRKKPADDGIRYLSQDAVSAILHEASESNIRHLAMLQLAYDSAARVSEICGLDIGKVRLDGPRSRKGGVVDPFGKGGKAGACPSCPRRRS